MNAELLFTIGIQVHGWLPAELYYGDFYLSIDASDGLNDPLEELLLVVTQLKPNEQRRVTWWLEPAAYFFDFTKIDEVLVLEVLQTNDLNQESAREQRLIKIEGTAREILRPFRAALKQFYSANYEEKHWSYPPDKNKIANLYAQ